MIYWLPTGAETIHSIFKLGRRLESGDQMDALTASLADARLLIIDEISMVGSEQAYEVSHRLELVARTLWRRHHRGSRDCSAQGRLDSEPEDFGGFGGLGVLLVGDFGQIPPIGDSSLIAPGRGQSQTAAAGQRLFAEFREVVRLRRVYRQKGASEFKDSTLRLRDAAMTVEDHALWASHDLSNLNMDPTLRNILEDEALWLLAENRRTGEHNGGKLVHLVTASGVPALAFAAEHSDEAAARRPSDEFYQLRTMVHMARGAPVMLTANLLWDTCTVKLGLMNGARGRIVAIVGEHLPPALPIYIVVDFPDYRGHPFWPDHPTYVPVPPIRRQSKKSPKLERRQLPLRLAWALTVHKSQGLTCSEGIVADLSSSTKTHLPAASPGLPFVAWTRVTSWERMGFRNLPSFGDFLQVGLWLCRLS